MRSTEQEIIVTNVHRKSVSNEEEHDVAGHFDGHSHFSLARWQSYTNPSVPDVEANAPTSIRYRHRDILNRVTFRTKDVLRYISPTYGKPLRAIVQVTNEGAHIPAPDWRRTEISGNAPWLLRLSNWSIEQLLDKTASEYTVLDFGIVFLKVLVTAPLQIVLVNFPMGDGSGRELQYYNNFPARSWAYPKYARNKLDAAPYASTEVAWESQIYDFAGEHVRQLRPRKLVVRHEEGWTIDDAPDHTSYIFISYTREHFDPEDRAMCQPLYQMAEEMAIQAGVNAYWLDHLCISQTNALERSDDIHRICDVIRNAYQVCVVVPSLQPHNLYDWGRRMWTMSEGLLADNKQGLKFCGLDRSTMVKSKISLADEIWGNDQTGRLLAEYFSSSLSLSKLEIISLGLEALSKRQTKALYTEGDLAYALMGLLGRRPRANPYDNHFQALARMSLANDSDRIVERMICMLPDTDNHDGGANSKFVLKDKFGANLWDIEPLCQVAGVCEGNAVMLDGCRGASVRWKDIPRIAFTKQSSWKRWIIALFLRSSLLWFFIAMICLIVQSMTIFVIFILLCLALSFATPWSIITLYGGKVWGAAPWLIGFEGVLPIREIEKLTFGNAIGRFSYAPSSSLLANRHETERIGKGPDWIEGYGPKPEIPAGHRFFTLVDTGTLTVTVFTAEKPPSVAVIAGREGGMLRTILCHYERSTATLHKQTVLRMETPMLDRTALLGWIKVE